MNKNVGVNISGFINKQFGLGEGVRSTIRSIAAADLNYVVNDFKIEISKEITESTEQKTSAENPYSINIVQINPDMLHAAFENAGANYFLHRYNIGYWAWELEEFPEKYLQVMERLDEIWVPSNFCAEAISKFSKVPVLKFMHSIHIDPPTLNRKELNVPQNKFIFFTMFDYHSSIHRKNPMATVEAFEKAFGKDNPDVMLVIKSSKPGLFLSDKELLTEKIENNSSIRLIEEMLDRDTLFSYMNCADCFISLHRSEGFGLTMAEAMYLGKPVIATDYSANREFLNQNNAFPVKYKLISTEDHYSFVGGNGFWADADTDHTAELMKFVVEHPAETKKIADKGQEDVHKLLSAKNIGVKMKSRIELIHREILPKVLNGESGGSSLHLENEVLHEKLEKLKSYAPIKMKIAFKNLKNKMTGSNRKYMWED